MVSRSTMSAETAASKRTADGMGLDILCLLGSGHR
jgi:hypothetical protein